MKTYINVESLEEVTWISLKWNYTKNLCSDGRVYVPQETIVELDKYHFWYKDVYNLQNFDKHGGFLQNRKYTAVLQEMGHPAFVTIYNTKEFDKHNKGEVERAGDAK